MRRYKVVLPSALVGAVVGLVAGRYGRGIVTTISAFALDRVSLAHRLYLMAAIPWILFSLYWEIAAKNAAEAKSSEALSSRRFHVFLANLALLLEIAPIRGLGRFLPLSCLSITGGLAVEVLGLFLAIWARRELGRNWSGEISIKVEHKLIRSGPYTLLRHPIYTGLLAMYVGTALVTGVRLAIIGIVIAIFAYWRKIRLEEANLRVAFGEAYDAYRRETWALVPGLY